MQRAPTRRAVRRLNNSIIAFILSVLFSTTRFAQHCSKVNVLNTDNLKNAQRFFTNIKTQAATDITLKQALAGADLFSGNKIMSPPGSFYFYQVDINNDQQKEYVFTYVGEGSMGIINIIAFTKKKGKFIYLGVPPKPATAGDGPWYFNGYRDPKTKQQQFLVKG